MVTVRLSSWILGLAFLGLPRLAQAQDVTSGTTIYGTGQSATNWAGGTISSGATLRLDDGGTVSGNVTNNGTLQYNESGNLTINNTIAGTGTLIKDGAGTLTLTQSSSLSGMWAINAGKISLLTSGNYALPTSSSGVTIASGAVLSADQTVNNHNHLGGVLTLNGGTLTSSNGPAGPANDGGYGNFYLKGVVVGGSSMSTISATTVTINSNSLNVGNVAVGTDLLISSSIISADGPSLIKTGDGTMTLTGANTYTAATTISAGTLQIGNGGTTGSLSASSAITNNGTLSFNRSNTITQATDFNSVISGTGAVTQAGSGTLVLSGTNTYSGGTTINSGTVRLGSQVNQALGTGTVVVNSGGTLITNRNALTNSLTLNGGTLQENNGFGSTFSGAIDLAATSTVTGASGRSMSFSNTVSGAGGLIKNGDNTVTLSGANTYTGTTTVSAGTLEVSGASGALTATSAVNINGGTLSLSGSAANRISDTAPISLEAAGSTLQLSGAVIETLGAMTLAGGVGARVIDFGVTSGVLTLASLSAASNLPLHIWNWSGTTGTGGGTDRLVISDGFLGGSLAASNVSFFSGSGTGLYSEATTFTSGGELVPSVSVSVPEPGTFFPAAVLVAAAFLRRRRGRCRTARA